VPCTRRRKVSQNWCRKKPVHGLLQLVSPRTVQATPAEAVFKQPLRHPCLVRRRHAAPPAMTNPILRKARPQRQQPEGRPSGASLKARAAD
jgi:hypothetical protein